MKELSSWVSRRVLTRSRQQGAAFVRLRLRLRRVSEQEFAPNLPKVPKLESESENVCHEEVRTSSPTPDSKAPLTPGQVCVLCCWVLAVCEGWSVALWGCFSLSPELGAC